MATRMFAALVPPPEVVEHLDEFLDVRRSAAAFRWTSVSQLHVTLAFMAGVPDRCLDDVVERLGLAAGRRPALTGRVCGGGAFPHVAGARVLYAGLACTDPAELDRLAVGCRNAAVASGVEVDGQRFRPHLTVARTGRPTEVSDWVRLLETYSGPAWEIDRIELVASYLGEGPRRRPRYETVA